VIVNRYCIRISKPLSFAIMKEFEHGLKSEDKTRNARLSRDSPTRNASRHSVEVAPDVMLIILNFLRRYLSNQANLFISHNERHSSVYIVTKYQLSSTFSIDLYMDESSIVV
jgi:hypothetical protein